jgi:hypothetical protein
MNHHKRFGIVPLIAVIILLISTSGCFHSYSKDKVAIVSEFCYAVPGAKVAKIGEGYALRSEFIDTDDYGRKLFAFSINTSLGISAVCILQKDDDKYVYYYDNVSYLMTEQFNLCTPEQLDALKDANDWNEAIDEEKMVKREFVNRFSLSPDRESTLDQQAAINAFYDTIGKEEKISTYVGVFDFSQTGQEIFFVSRDEKRATNTGHEWINIDYYLMILNADGTYDPENYLIKLDDLDKSNAPLAEIKEKNDWEG